MSKNEELMSTAPSFYVVTRALRLYPDDMYFSPDCRKQSDKDRGIPRDPDSIDVKCWRSIVESIEKGSCRGAGEGAGADAGAGPQLRPPMVHGPTLVCG